MVKSAISNRTKLIVLEGLPGSGKTRHIEFLSKHSYKIIKEIALKPPKALGEAFFLKNDIEKYKLVPPKGIIVMDRNYASTLAYNFSMLLNSDFAFFDVLRWYLSAKKYGKIWQPYSYIYIKTPIKESLKRKKRKIAHPAWSDPAKLRMMTLFYWFFFTFVERRVNVIDGIASIATQRKELLAFLHKIKSQRNPLDYN